MAEAGKEGIFLKDAVVATDGEAKVDGDVSITTDPNNPQDIHVENFVIGTSSATINGNLTLGASSPETADDFIKVRVCFTDGRNPHVITLKNNRKQLKHLKAQPQLKKDLTVNSQFLLQEHVINDDYFLSNGDTVTVGYKKSDSSHMYA